MMITRTLLHSAVLLHFLSRCVVGDVPISALDSVNGWNAVGRARVESDDDGMMGDCLKLTFRTQDPQPFAIVQGPSMLLSDAWKQQAHTNANAIAFYAKASTPAPLEVVLNVRSRTITGRAGVAGQLRATVAITSRTWKRYAVRFSDFTGTSDLMPVGDNLFTTWWPQPQFHMQITQNASNIPMHVWIDELAFASVEQSSPAQMPIVYPGLDAAATFVPTSPVQATVLEEVIDSRTKQELRTDWCFAPFDNTKMRFTPETKVSLPHSWPWWSTRNYSSGCYVHDFETPATMDDRRIILKLERVAYHCVLFVNGQRIGEHGGGYTPFQYDLSPAIRSGRNRLTLYVMDANAAIIGDRAVHQLGVTQPQNLRYDGGILGRIWIESMPNVCVEDVFVKTSTGNKRIEVECEVHNGGKTVSSPTVTFSIRNWATGEKTMLDLPNLQTVIEPGETKTLSVATTWRSPELWSPDHPHLYLLRTELSGQTIRDSFDQRFGFREFSIEGGQFYLNGTPTRLRGPSAFRGHSSVTLSLNRKYIRTVMRAWKNTVGVNAFRLHASIASEPVLEVADEEGLLLINQSSIWSAMGNHYRRGGDALLQNTRQEFEEWVRRDRNHPSCVIWDVENEQIRGSGRDKNSDWVLKLDDFVRDFDTTRPIEHSGAGWYEPNCNIFHVHMEEHYTRLFEIWRHNPKRPLVNGEYWIGGRGEARLTSSLETGSRAEYLQEELRLYHEAMVEQRAYGVSGVMPFTLWQAAFAPLTSGGRVRIDADANDPDPRPDRATSLFNPGWIESAPLYRMRENARQLAHNSLGPVTAFFWPRTETSISGSETQRTIIICNDGETSAPIPVRWGSANHIIGEITVMLAPAEQRRISVTVPAPSPGVTETLFVEADSESRESTRDELEIRGIDPVKLQPPLLRHPPLCLDTNQLVQSTLDRYGIKTIECACVPAAEDGRLWIIAPDASGRDLEKQSAEIRRFLEQGGRILCLSQNELPKWSPVRLNSWSAIRQAPTAFIGFGWQNDWKEIYYSRHAPIYAPKHPAFDGLPFHDLRWWNSTDGRVSDDAYARPSATDAVARGNWRPLLGATRRENMSLVEISVGKGTLMLCAAHVIRESTNPEARLLLWNLLRYLDRMPLETRTTTVACATSQLQGTIEKLTGVNLPVFDDTFDGSTVFVGPRTGASRI